MNGSGPTRERNDWTFAIIALETALPRLLDRFPISPALATYSSFSTARQPTSIQPRKFVSINQTMKRITAELMMMA